MGKAYIRDNINDHLFSFKEHLKVKNYSSMSISAYSHHLQGLFDYLKDINTTDLKRVTRDILKDFQLKIMQPCTIRCRAGGKGYARDTISIKLRSVKRFFEYLEETNHILINPAEYIKEPKKETRLPRVVLTEDEARKILDMPNLSTMTGIRDRTVLEVFYSTGIRLEEMVNLTIYDCDLQGGLLRVNKGKFAKDRVVPLGRHAIRFLKEYITHVRPHYMKKRSQNPESRSQKKHEQTRIPSTALRTTPSTVLRTSLFVNQSGKPLSKIVIQIMVRNYARKAKIKKKVTPHTFRHTFATQLVRNGADITAVQKMLGHSDLSVTHIYTKVAGVEVKKTHSTRHPREKDKEVSASADPLCGKEEITPHIKGIKGKYRRD